MRASQRKWLILKLYFAHHAPGAMYAQHDS
jgi:hypothetical protein